MIRFEHKDEIVSIVIETKEEHIDDIMITFRGFLLACTFSESLVDQYIKLEG